MQVKVTVMKTVRDTLLPVGMPFTDILIEFGFGSAYLCVSGNKQKIAAIAIYSTITMYMNLM